MSNGNIGGIVGVGLGILALGVVAKVAVDMTKEIAKQSKTKNSYKIKGKFNVEKMIWG
jgi:hypothetical protein